MRFNVNFKKMKQILKKSSPCKKKVVFLQCVTVYIHSSLSREFTLFVKGFINFGFWFWGPSPLKRRSLFFVYFCKSKKNLYLCSLLKHKKL